jgi:histidine kinase
MKLLEKASKIAEGINSSVYRLPKGDFYNQDVILKVIKEDFNYYPHSSQLYNEDELIRNLKIDGIRASIELISDAQTPILVLQYFDGTTLKEWLKDYQPSFIDSLRIAIKICDSLTKVHALNIIHRDISPYNILINNRQETSIIDFGLASKVNLKQNVKGISDQLEGTLPYISPEQTGRVNHVVDQRSDIYSLGAVFYELFTGKLPFPFTDPLELVHAHLAKLPDPLNEVNELIPAIFSNIILKMMAKDVENRYQSASGLLDDLNTCLKQVAQKVEIQDFALAKNDQSGKFLIPSKLYGRAEDQKILINSIDNIGTQGHKEITLVTGRSGTGKTSLIYEIHKPITEKKGHFIRGKFEQLHKDRPYQAITQAFGGFVTLLLSENETKLNRWKEKILAEIGNQGKLLTDLIPNLELIIGKQQELPILGINEAQNRFIYIFQQFIKALANEKHPMVLFVDDLQWADNASLQLIKNIVLNDEINHFYIVGAYRDNEVISSDPLMLTIQVLESKNTKINTIALDNLSFEETNELVSDIFHRKDNEILELTNIIYSKTAGNPFFVNEFLKSIYEREFVWYEHASENSSKVKGSWKWDIENLQNTNFTDNVVEFMIEKLNKIDPKTQHVLKLASCIGDSFDLNTITNANNQSSENILQDLWQAVIEQLLIVEENNSPKPNSSNKGEIERSYKFAHDRIRQAAYGLIPENEKAKLHQSIGELLLEKIDLSEYSDRVFDVVYQLNKGIPKNDIKYRQQVIKLNQLAGNKARNATAYETAYNFFEIAINHATDEDWATASKLIFECHLGAMESAYLLGRYARMEAIGTILLGKYETKTDELRIHQIIIYALIAQSKHLEVINYGLDVMKTVGIKLPTKPNDLHIIQALIKTKWMLRNHKPASFENIELVDSKELQLAISIMSSISTGAYHNYPKLFPLVIFKSMQIASQNRLSIDSIPFFGGYAAILCGVTGDYSIGFDYGLLSLKLLQKPWDTKAIIPKTNVIFSAFINHWKQHQKEALPYLKDAYLISLETGDNQYAASALFLETYTEFQCGMPLRDVVSNFQRAYTQFPSFNQDGYYLYLTIIYQGVLNLAQNESDPNILAGTIFKAEQFLNNEIHVALRHDRTAYFHILYSKLYLNYLLGNYELALSVTDEIKKYEDVVMSTSYIPLVNFYDSLTRLSICETPNGAASKSKQISQIKKNQKKLKIWSQHSPANYLHKYHLIEAELLSINRKNTESIAAFELSINHSRENEFTNELALAFERLAIHYSRQGDRVNESQFMAKAYRNYIKWGAKSKVAQMKNLYPYLIERTQESTTISRSHTYGSVSGNSILDLTTILKAASTISSEIQLNKAIPTLLNIVMENAGAQLGAFILNTTNQLVLYALNDSLGKNAEILTPVDIATVDNIPKSILQYVKRTNESIVVESALEDERFSSDAYVRERQIQSVICLPIIHHGNLLGIIYLENKLAKGTFNLHQVDLLSLLSGQIAITLHNAILYDSLEQKVNERTQEIAEQKEMLNEQNVQLTEINKEKDYLINVVSHDLRNPLYLIKGFASMAAHELKNHDASKLVEPILSSCDRLDNLINRILDTSAINAREIKLQYQEIDLLMLIKEEMEGFASHAKNKQINLSLTSDDHQIKIEIDENYLRQIIGNLISNAIKYTFENGDVTIHIEENENSVLINVSDTGQGISAKDQKLLFNQFQPLTAKPTSGEKSIGIGLSIVKKYVEAMNGTIRVKSEPKKGSTFTIDFPKNQKKLVG